jgi:two-component system, LuxR family, response regulator FixJ
VSRRTAVFLTDPYQCEWGTILAMIFHASAPLTMIYLVEDDDDTRDAIAMLLDCEALPVRAFASCDHLLRTLDPKAADCLVLDVQMRGTTGLDLLERLKIKPETLPVIIMTGNLTPQVRARATAAGAFAVLEKPFDGNKLVDIVRLALTGRGAAAQGPC